MLRTKVQNGGIYRLECIDSPTRDGRNDIDRRSADSGDHLYGPLEMLGSFLRSLRLIMGLALVTVNSSAA